MTTSAAPNLPRVLVNNEQAAAGVANTFVVRVVRLATYRSFWLLTFATVLAFVAMNGATRTGTPAASMYSDQPAVALASGPKGQFRVATYNIRSGVGMDGKLDLDRTCKNFNGADLVALNEVRGYHLSSSSDQAQDMGKLTKMSSVFAPTERRWWGDDFGNAILSAKPLASWQRIPLVSTQTRGYRNVVILTTKVNDQPVKVLITHLDRLIDRQQQLAAVSDLFCSLQPPVVLMGDLNTAYDDPLIQPLLNRPDVLNAMNTSICPNPPKDVEYILARGLKVVASGSMDNGASDHCCLWADLQLQESVASR